MWIFFCLCRSCKCSQLEKLRNYSLLKVDEVHMRQACKKRQQEASNYLKAVSISIKTGIKFLNQFQKPSILKPKFLLHILDIKASYRRCMYHFLCTLEKFNAINVLPPFQLHNWKAYHHIPWRVQKGIFKLTPTHHKVQDCDFATY